MLKKEGRKMINDVELREEWENEMREEAERDLYYDNLFSTDLEAITEHITDNVVDDVQDLLDTIKHTLDAYGWEFEDSKEILHEIIDNI